VSVNDVQGIITGYRIVIWLQTFGWSHNTQGIVYLANSEHCHYWTFI